MDLFHGFAEWQEQILKHRELLNYDVSKNIFEDKVSFEMKKQTEWKLNGIYVNHAVKSAEKER